jgi:uncharacterized membrane protein YcjF (UPF0283 family)
MAAERRVRRRFWVEGGSALASLALLVVTLINQEWIEAVFGVDPDHGNGAFEWTIVAVLALIAVVGAVTARAEWRAATATS